jgi:copper chaperone
MFIAVSPLCLPIVHLPMMGRSAIQMRACRHNSTIATFMFLEANQMTIEFQVEGMSCQHCVAAVTNAIREQDAAAQVKVDLPTGRVAVDSAQSVETLKAAIDEAGYTVVNAH